MTLVVAVDAVYKAKREVLNDCDSLGSVLIVSATSNLCSGSAQT